MSGLLTGVGPDGLERHWVRRVRGHWLGLATPLAALVCSLCAATNAQAAISHHFLSSLSEAPPGTLLEEPASVAVDHATGQIFVGNEGGGVVDVYSSSGVFQTQFGEEIEAGGVAVDEATGDVYVAEPFGKALLAYRPDGKGGYQLLAEWFGAGTPGKGFGEVTGVAFDNAKEGGSDPSAGDVYVVESESTDTGTGAVDVFKPRPNPGGSEPGEGEEGEFLKRLAGPKLEEPNAVAVDSATGRVLVADSGKGFIATFSDAGAFEEKLTGKGQPFGSFRGKEEEEENIAGLAVDEGTGEIYVAEAEHHAISQYNPSGEWLGWTTTAAAGAALGEPREVALTSAGDVYGADAGLGVVDLFGPGVLVPDVATSKASKLTRTTAILSGTINGDGNPAKYAFQWGATEALGQSTPLTGSGTGEEKVSIALEGLHAGTTYFFRIIGENENGANYGLLREFTTPPAVEALNTGVVKELAPTSAALTGSLTPGGFETTYYFKWGTSSAYGNTAPSPAGNAGSGTTPVEATVPISGLAPNTLYHYRLVGENEFGITEGLDRTFTTSGPPRITNESPTELGHEAATLHARINPDEIATTYHIEYGPTTAYGTEVPIGGASIGEGANPVAVQAAITGVQIGTVYHYRVIAENTAGTTTGPDEVFETIPPAPIDAAYATNVNATEATLNTQINPLGNSTTYYFQYGTQSCKQNPASCTSTPTPPGEEVGSGNTDVAKSLHIQGLQPNTTYHFRVIDHNTLGTTEGIEHTLTTQTEETPLALPDSRAWEMVSPVDKHGALVEALTREGGVILAAEDGNSFTYVADGAITNEVEGNRSPEEQQVISTRTQKGWTFQDIATPNSAANGTSAGAPPEYQFFTPDLSAALVEPWGNTSRAEPPLSPEATQKTIYLRDNSSETYRALVTEANTPPGTEFGHKMHLVSATPDLRHAVIRTEAALTPPPSGQGLYEWADGALQFVSLLPAGVLATAPELGYFHVTAHAVSSDGSRVIWTTAEEGKHGHLYMRDTETHETIQLDAAQGTPEPVGKGSAQFQTANGDGSRVFFTDKQRLTANATTEALAGRADLYECEIVENAGKLSCDLTDLTVDHNEGEHATVQNLLFGASEDGSYVYLVAQGVLAGNENGNGDRAEAGKDNLYALHFDGTQWTSTFIAALTSEDKAEWEGSEVANTSYLTARVSPNGRYLAFMAAESLTGYDNVDQNGGGKRDEEVYLYDASAASLRCVSCNPTGERPVGVLDTEKAGEGLGLLADRRLVWLGHWLGGNIPGWTAESIVGAAYQSRYLSDEGRLYFNSADSLVPQAKNGREDVYEFEPSGLGSCQSPTGGCVSLISGGSSDRESAFLEATPSGNDVFLLTEAQLLPQDTDTAFDVYDARVCTGASPCLTPPTPAPPGCGDASACRPAQPAQPLPGGPSGTATFAGPGSPVASPPKQQDKGTKATTKPKPPTRAQRLAKALSACRRRFAHSKNRRRACEAHARKLYGPKVTGKKARAKRSKVAGSGAHSSGRGRR